jgi:hypothetical protein
MQKQQYTPSPNKGKRKREKKEKEDDRSSKDDDEEIKKAIMNISKDEARKIRREIKL